MGIYCSAVPYTSRSDLAASTILSVPIAPILVGNPTTAIAAWPFGSHGGLQQPAAGVLGSSAGTRERPW